MSFARRLQHERTAKGWTQEQLAAASGVSVTQIARIEHQRVEASEQAQERLLAALQAGQAAPAAQAAAAPQPSAAPTQHSAPAPAPAPQPLALHLNADMRAQLEAAAVAHGRSLHGEVLARLMASLVEASSQPPAVQGTVQTAPATPSAPALALSLIHI